jgi:hypothetical protein
MNFDSVHNLYSVQEISELQELVFQFMVETNISQY